jgi:hypothetical protein
MVRGPWMRVGSAWVRGMALGWIVVLGIVPALSGCVAGPIITPNPTIIDSATVVEVLGEDRFRVAVPVCAGEEVDETGLWYSGPLRASAQLRYRASLNGGERFVAWLDVNPDTVATGDLTDQLERYAYEPGVTADGLRAFEYLTVLVIADGVDYRAFADLGSLRTLERGFYEIRGPATEPARIQDAAAQEFIASGCLSDSAGE